MSDQPKQSTVEMKDRKGQPVTVGARVYVLPQQGWRKGGVGWVRAISEGHPPFHGVMARCDDGPRGLDIEHNKYTFSSWCKPSEFEILTTP